MGSIKGVSLGSPSDAIFSVSEFNGRVKTVLEGAIGPCWIRGEISNYREQASGHIYFTLKDGESQLSVVLFRGYASQLSIELAAGKRVLVYGEVNVYEPRGQYQVIARFILDDGQGQLELAFQQLKKALGEEGLFDIEKKKALPLLPKVVGFVTSPSGAAIRDFLSILRRRDWYGRVIVVPAQVQGKGSAESIVEALGRAEALGIFDLLVIGRGGGSIEDLWAFNEEVLVRAVAECSVPVISAVGHEIDFVLTDFSADYRAETPSAAAEWISSQVIECRRRLEGAGKGFEPRLFQRVLEYYTLQLDDKQYRLEGVLRDFVRGLRGRVQIMEKRLDELSPRFILGRYGERLMQLERRVEASNPGNILKRGFAWVRAEGGAFVTSQGAAEVADSMTISFSDGDIAVKRR